MTSEKVKNFYNNNYLYFDVTRVRIWPTIRNLPTKLKKGCKILEAGCGNGKNLDYLKLHGMNVYGIDFSEKLLGICKNKNLNVRYADIRNIPFPDNYFDCVISPAVIHHLKFETDRYKAIDEMLRVCKPNCRIIVSVWAVEQDDDSNRKFVFGDNFVSWKNQYRYYFIYNKVNLLKFLEKYNIERLFWEKGNWYFIIKK